MSGSERRLALPCIDWRKQFYINKCLPFGLHSAPYLFNLVARALAWIIKDQAHILHIIHYLDNFLLAGSPQFEEIIDPTTILPFLEIKLDTVAQIARLPEGKLTELLSELRLFCCRKSCTKRKLLSVIGN